MTSKTTRLLTAAEVADLLSVPAATVRLYTRRGELTDVAINIGTPKRPLWRYDPARLTDWIEQRRTRVA